MVTSALPSVSVGRGENGIEIRPVEVAQERLCSLFAWNAEHLGGDIR
jgi:hypothetical protein